MNCSWIILVLACFAAYYFWRSHSKTTTVSGAAPKEPGTRDVATAGKPDEAAASCDLLPDLSLVDKDTDFLGPVLEGQFQGVRVLFSVTEGGISISAGDYDPDQEQLTDIYLSQVSSQAPLPKDGSSQRLDKFLDSRGQELAQRFFLNATGATSYPALQKSEVRSAFLKLSPSVLEVGILENDGGVDLIIDRHSASKDSVASDLQLAVSAFKALRA